MAVLPERLNVRAAGVLRVDGSPSTLPAMIALLHELSGAGLGLAVIAGLVLAVIGIFIAIDKGPLGK